MGETHILLLRRRSLTLRGEKRRTLEGLSVMVPGLLGMWAESEIDESQFLFLFSEKLWLLEQC